MKLQKSKTYENEANIDHSKKRNYIYYSIWKIQKIVINSEFLNFV